MGGWKKKIIKEKYNTGAAAKKETAGLAANVVMVSDIRDASRFVAGYAVTHAKLHVNPVKSMCFESLVTMLASSHTTPKRDKESPGNKMH